MSVVWKQFSRHSCSNLDVCLRAIDFGFSSTLFLEGQQATKISNTEEAMWLPLLAYFRESVYNLVGSPVNQSCSCFEMFCFNVLLIENGANDASLF